MGYLEASDVPLDVFFHMQVGAADDDGAADALRDGTGDGLAKGLLQIGDAAASLKIPWERQTKDMMQVYFQHKSCC